MYSCQILVLHYLVYCIITTTPLFCHCYAVLLLSSRNVTSVFVTITTLYIIISCSNYLCYCILCQTLPDVFQKHKIYSLPVEDNQIRKGGNGTIFATDYMGYNLVAKKTLFRNREYNIVQRLKHPNIVPLLALMVGEVSHRRRFFCYHMLPRMSCKPFF